MSVETGQRTGDDEEWDAALETFDAIADLGSTEFAAAMAALQADDPKRYARVLSLVRADQVAADRHFLDGGAVRDALEQGEPPVDKSVLLPNIERVGPWRLERSLGAGGMGRVWLARRHDGLYEGQVAIKMLRDAVADELAAARFAREGELLAKLNHTNIARLLDAGSLPDGQRYLVLEYVRGERIDAYADARRLGVAARIALFLQVCAAVNHAHANLIVHRDLKPANILVQDDGKVKLLDFGVAKMIETDAANDESPLTRVAGAALTPEYAAPEQVEDGAITTATDVYSLGMVLYRLLSGGRPYGDGTASPARLARAIVETEPRLLSAAIAGPAAAEAAALRQTTVERLRRQLAGDLDNILAKALKKRPGDRYGSVRALMDDLEAYLDNRPVLACPDSVGYRLGKFVRRHKVGVAASLALTMAVVAGIVGVVWQARIAIEQKNEAERQSLLAHTESDKASAVKQFMIDLFRANLSGSTDIEAAQHLTARQLLDTGSASIESQFAAQPELQGELLDIVGELYFRLGEHERAKDLTRKRIAILERLQRDTVEDRMSSYGNLATLAWQLGDTAGQREAVDAIARQTPAEDRTPVNQASLLFRQARIELYTNPRRVVALVSKAADLKTEFDHIVPISPHDLAAGEIAVRALSLLGRHELARRQAEADVEIARRLSGDNHFTVGIALAALGESEAAAMRFAAAEEHLRAALSISRRTQGKAHPRALIVQAQLGAVLHRGGRRGEGIALMEEAIRLNGRSTGRNATDDLRMRLLLGEALLDEGRLAQAEGVIGTTLAELRGNADLRLLLARALTLHSRLALARGHTEAAIAAADEARSIYASALGEENAAVGAAMVALAEAELLAGHGGVVKALNARAALIPVDVGRGFPHGRLMRERLAGRLGLWLGQLGSASTTFGRLAMSTEAESEREYHRDLLADAYLGRGRTFIAEGNCAPALGALEKAVDLRRHLGPSDSPWLAEAKVALAECLIREGARERAAELLAEAQAAYDRHAPLGRQFLYPLEKVKALMDRGEAGQRAPSAAAGPQSIPMTTTGHS